MVIEVLVRISLIIFPLTCILSGQAHGQVYFIEPTEQQLVELEEKYPNEYPVIVKDMQYYATRASEICLHFNLSFLKMNSNAIGELDVDQIDLEKIYWKIILISEKADPLFLTPDNFFLIPNYFLPIRIIGEWQEVSSDPYYCRNTLYFKPNTLIVENMCDGSELGDPVESNNWRIMEQVLILPDTNQYHRAIIKTLRNDSLLIYHGNREYLFLRKN